MSAESILARARAQTEALMTSRCRIERFELTLDTGTLDLSDLDSSDDLIYRGPCRLRSPSSAVFIQATEGQTLAAQQEILSLPVTAGALPRVGDRVTIEDGGPDQGLTGRRYRVAGLFSQTYATAARIPVESIA